MSWVVDAFGEWYPTVYPHRDEAEASRFVARISRAIPLEERALLDVGCGAGRHLARFREAGARPVGVDLSPQLLGEARRWRDSVCGEWALVRGDMRRLPLADRSFAVVTSLFTSFGYFSADEDRAVAREWARVLRPGGRHVLDFLNRRAVRGHLKPVTVRESGEWRVREDRRIVDDGPVPRVVKRVRVEPAAGGSAVADYEEAVTLYGLADLEGMLATAGLAVEERWGDYAGAPFDESGSPRLVLLSRREED